MFGKMQDMFKQAQTVQKMMKDDNVKALISHPKVQALFKDADFQVVVKSQDPAKIMGHPKLMALLRDPEVAPLLSKVDLQAFLKA